MIVVMRTRNRRAPSLALFQAREKAALLGVLLPILLIGCGSNTDSAKDSQVVAKVNDTEVTLHQLNYELGLLGQGQVAVQNPDKITRQTLEDLVSQQVVAQKAITEKLDRYPQIMQALERTKRQVLVQAYIKKITERDTTPPGKQEVTDYYNQHPELFAKRRIYQIREILLDKTLPMAEIQAKMGDSMSLEALVSWLESKKVKMQSGVVVKPAEQLPFEMLSRLAQMRQGQVMVVEAPTNILLSILMDIRDQPVSEVQATQSIERFLVTQKREKLAEAEIKRLRSEAKVELLGKFAAQGSASAAGGRTPEAAAAQEKEPSPSAAAVPSMDSTRKENPGAKSGNADFMEKGAAGL